MRKVEVKWHLLDADNKVLGRIATEAATLLIGKHKVTYMPNLDEGDWVVVINAEKVRLTGRKESQKMYRRHSGYPGGFRELSAAQVREKHPERLLIYAIKGMLPDNRLKALRMKRLKVVVGKDNPYAEKF